MKENTSLHKSKQISKFRTLLFVLIGAMLLSACSFGLDVALSPPVLLDNRDRTTISWSRNSKASEYQIYLNNSVVETIQETGENTYTYNYGDDIAQDGLYTIKAKCIGGGSYRDSRFSNTITIRVGENQTGGYDTSEISIVRNSSYAPNDIEYLSDSRDIWWTATKKDGISASKYVIQIFCNNYTESTDNSDKIRSFYVQQPFFNVEEYLKGNEVLAISVSSVYPDDDNLYASEVFYYNPLSLGEYSEVYVFDGGVYDKYIEDYEELQNIYYYAYITRQTEIKFMVSANFYLAHTSDYFNETRTTEYFDDGSSQTIYEYQKYMMGVTGKVNNISGFNYWSYYETFNFTIPTLEITPSKSGSNAIVLHKIAYFNNIEPTLNASSGSYVGLSDVSITQYSLEKPYYETVDYDKRDSTYNNFESDKCVLTTECNTSEELYWAVENNVTPIFTNTTSRAYLIYQNAKAVLRDIICDDMTTYEKALSIFDWVSNTCQYDYNGYYNSASTDNSCYYLEGMFLDKNHVVVCDGISKAYSLLCNMEGIDCIRIMGTAGGGGHAWNKVKISGKWYVVDITWTELKQTKIKTDSDGNIVYGVGTYQGKYYRYPIIEENVYEYNCHQYFLVSDDYISSTHTPFANRAKISNSNIPANDMYGFYTQKTILHKGTWYSRVIDSNEDMKGILDYIYCNDLGKFEVILDATYLNSFGNNLTNVLQNARDENLFIGIEQNGYMFKQTEHVLTLINKDGSTVSVKAWGEDKGEYVGTYNCTYEDSYETPFVSIVYKYSKGLYSTKSTSGIVVYLQCNTNILDVDDTNISDTSNRYNKFIEYVKTTNSLESTITIQDDFLTDVLGLDLDASTDSQIIQAIKAYFENDLNADLVDSCYEVALQFVESGEDSSNVYNSSTSDFEVKTYNYHKYKINIELNNNN